MKFMHGKVIDISVLYARKNGSKMKLKTLAFRGKSNIILTFQTLGSLISNSVFTCLKKKYVNQQIFLTEGNIGFYKLARSLNRKTDESKMQLKKMHRLRSSSQKEIHINLVNYLSRKVMHYCLTLMPNRTNINKSPYS